MRNNFLCIKPQKQKLLSVEFTNNYQKQKAITSAPLNTTSTSLKPLKHNSKCVPQPPPVSSTATVLAPQPRLLSLIS
ncbi:782c8a96-06f4-4b95-b6cf-2760fb059616-CDS [Sclerotinia trifoliorum]|uniref:782c8a96-06f4-4b95-b6cf-2760fb059616-CDS n=1 Tax=Sclerotinia trifoliorum TaxID=28548 RepID=A0A8H2W477_9HELO|nr:782c8a96-06f4-4b95-b6cf-2760fb059616-CDS [Sclerotinia trifoliorum]